MNNYMDHLIYLGSDHAGFELKQEILGHLKRVEMNVEDCGTFDSESVDYPDYAQKVAQKVQSNQKSLGILICGTGIGMSIAANKFPGIRAALVNTIYMAEMARRHNNANILCLGSRILTLEQAQEIVDTWLEEKFEGDRHQGRLDKISQVEQNLE